MTPVTLAEMRDAAASEARRIEMTQDALVAAALRAAPHEGQLRRRDAFDAIVRLLDAVRARPSLMEELSASVATAAAARRGRP